MMQDYEAQRLENLKQKDQLLARLNLDPAITAKKAQARPSTKPPTKKRKLNTPLNTTPARTSARIASSESKPYYAHDGDRYIFPQPTRTKSRNTNIKRTTSPATDEVSSNTASYLLPAKDKEAIRAGWTSWAATAPPPTRDDEGTFHFPDWPTFTPNKAPEEIIREGSFGGSYWRPLRSQKLGIIIEDDWRELPDKWIEGLDVDRYLISPGYEASANKFGVACGQSIEEWEAAGWINLTYDVRGWFQWYCRFFQGRRCDDDERQVGRWARCVGATGRWRRTLLKKYVQNGVKDVFDDGEREQEVSPVMHQTCHHWAFEVRQGVLDEYWRTGK